MKTEKATETKSVKIEYWICTKMKHRHKTIEIAERCIEKSTKPRPKKNHWNEEKRKEVLERWRRGNITKTALGKEYNVSCERMRQVIAKAERIERARSN